MTSKFTNLPAVDLDVIELDFAESRYQTLVINLPQPGVLIQPDILPHLELPAMLDLSREVILFGQAPTWLYCYLIDQCQGAPWMGCYNALLGAVVVIHSRLPYPKVGKTLVPKMNAEPGAAVLIGGPPDSGKSLLCNALRRNIAKLQPNCRLFLHRANWDGQGNWAYESRDSELTEKLVLGFDAKLHWHPEALRLVPQYFQEQAKAVQNLCKVRDLVLVDVGGVPQPEKHPVVNACSHYLIISRDPDAIAAWHKLCAPTLPCLAILHSGSEGEATVFSPSSPLELKVSLAELAAGILSHLLLEAISQI